MSSPLVGPSSQISPTLACVTEILGVKPGGCDKEQWDDLSSIMNSVVLSSSKDRWTCDLSGDGEFKVKVIKNFIDD
ncbi:hypothetical protein Tco_0498182, partial [Tanacetum coccineum]